MTVTHAGIHPMTADEYHADPIPGGSLSSSGARKLLPPSCPALFRHEQLHGQPHKAVFDLGHAAHRLVLSAGADIIQLDADDYRRKATREARDNAYAEGLIPVLPDEYQCVTAMASALLRHPIAAALLNHAAGKPEQALFWPDPETGVWRRALIDFMPDPVSGRRMIVPDYKTARCASNDAFQRAAAEYGYHQQGAWYLDGVECLDISYDAAFVFIVQEKTAPYLVNVIELDSTAMKIGRALNRRALRVYAECRETDQWPGYSDDVEHISLPYWYESRKLAEIEVAA
jgi:hypothetical protein